MNPSLLFGKRQGHVAFSLNQISICNNLTTKSWKLNKKSKMSGIFIHDTFYIVKIFRGNINHMTKYPYIDICPHVEGDCE